MKCLSSVHLLDVSLIVRTAKEPGRGEGPSSHPHPVTRTEMMTRNPDLGLREVPHVVTQGRETARLSGSRWRSGRPGPDTERGQAVCLLGDGRNNLLPFPGWHLHADVRFCHSCVAERPGPRAGSPPFLWVHLGQACSSGPFPSCSMDASACSRRAQLILPPPLSQNRGGSCPQLPESSGRCLRPRQSPGSRFRPPVLPQPPVTFSLFPSVVSALSLMGPWHTASNFQHLL